MKNLLVIVLLPTVFGIVYWLLPHSNKVINGTILYAISSDGVIFKIDPLTCEACPILNPTGVSSGVFDLVVLPDGNILVQTFDGLRLYDPPNPNPIWSNNTTYGGSILAPNGLVYLSQPGSTPGLSVFDPATNSITFIGNWPPNIIVEEFFYQSGLLYALAQEGPPPFMARVIQVNLINPDQSTIVVINAPFNATGGTTNNGYTTSISTNGSANILRQYNVNNNTFTTLCTLPTSMNGLSDLPSGIAEAACLCTTLAGTVNNSTFNVCIPGSVTVPYNNNAVLGSGDILRYILFSDQSDTLGSIIVQSNTATIPFNPATMQTGVPYYLATIAGDNLGGNVDLNDPCLDISNVAAQVIWRPRPEVSFTVNNPNICAGDCRMVTANFTGTPPFTLTYSTPAGTITQSFSGNTGSFQVCVPAGTASGVLNVQAVSVTDAWCGCV